MSALESTKWLQHLSVMLKAAVLVANTVDREGRPVLVHCSDGWDRTPQIVALAKILLDPYYRTLEVLRGVGRERAGGGEFGEVLNPLCLPGDLSLENMGGLESSSRFGPVLL